MAQIRISTKIEVIDLNGKTRIHNLLYTNTSVNELREETISISANGTVVVWDPVNSTDNNITDFDTLVIFADGTLDIEFTTNEGDSNEEISTKRIVKGAPIILGADDSYYNHSASDAFAGTLDVIDRIRVDEPNSTAVNLTMILIS